VLHCRSGARSCRSTTSLAWLWGALRAVVFCEERWGGAHGLHKRFKVTGQIQWCPGFLGLLQADRRWPLNPARFGPAVRKGSSHCPSSSRFGEALARGKFGPQARCMAHLDQGHRASAGAAMAAHSVAATPAHPPSGNDRGRSAPERAAPPSPAPASSPESVLAEHLLRLLRCQGSGIKHGPELGLLLKRSGPGL